MSGKSGTSCYAYPVVEKALDDFISGVNSTGLHRAYYKMKLCLLVYLHADFSPDQALSEELVSWAWEDLEIAFKGYGDEVLTGHVLTLWSFLGGKQRTELTKVLKRAFKKAEKMTSPSVRRRYFEKWRKKKIHDPDVGFDGPTILPVFGPRVGDWAQETGRSWKDVEDEFIWAEYQERVERLDREAEVGIRNGCHLRLVNNEKER